MKKEELLKLVGKKVKIEFYNDKTETGVLKYVDEFSRKHEYRQLNYFYIDKNCFLTSHIKKLKVED